MSAKGWAWAWRITILTVVRTYSSPTTLLYNSLFHNLGNKFEEVAFETGVALTEDGSFISGMGLDFRDFNNDGYPDIAFVALNNQTFPLFQNTGKGEFREVTTRKRHARSPAARCPGFGAALYDFDNDGWKDLFVSRGHVESLTPSPDSRLINRTPSSATSGRVGNGRR